MILPVYAYGQKVLKQKGINIDSDYESLTDLIANMWETMYNAKGIGLAAPQIGKGIRLFLVDTKQIEDDEKEIDGLKEVFINAQIVGYNEIETSYEEGCLSIPDIKGDVRRPSKIDIEYFNEKFEKKKATFDGITARVIQHEYDHIEGILFTEKLPPLRKRLIKRKLENIRKGKISVDYRMRFTKLK